MDTNVQSIVNDILAKAIQTATATGDFLKEQIPEVVTQLLRWSIAEHAVWIVLSSIALIISWKFWKFGKKLFTQDDSYFPIFFATTGSTILPGICFVYHSLGLLKLLIAPKLWLLEYAAHLIGK